METLHVRKLIAHIRGRCCTTACSATARSSLSGLRKLQLQLLHALLQLRNLCAQLSVFSLEQGVVSSTTEATMR